MRLIDADDLLTAFPEDDEPEVIKNCLKATIQHMPTIEAIPISFIDELMYIAKKNHDNQTVYSCLFIENYWKLIQRKDEYWKKVYETD